MTPLTRALIITLTLGGTATAAPYLGTTTAFTGTSFCRSHTCKLVATVPSGSQDQLHYDVDSRWRVIVWQYPNDLKRVGGQQYAKLRGRVNAVSMIWYGLQDTPFGSEGTFAELVGLASGKNPGKDTALQWLDDSNPESQLRYWNNFGILRNNGLLPSANAAILELMVMIVPR